MKQLLNALSNVHSYLKASSCPPTELLEQVETAMRSNTEENSAKTISDRGCEFRSPFMQIVDKQQKHDAMIFSEKCFDTKTAADTIMKVNNGILNEEETLQLNQLLVKLYIGLLKK